MASFFDACKNAPLALLAGGLWLLMVGGLFFLDRQHTNAPPICHIKRLTHVPCATCGGTRATAALLQARVLDAVKLNPWVVAFHFGALISFGALLLRRPNWNVFGRLLKHPHLAIAVLLVSLGLNWLYVLQIH